MIRYKKLPENIQQGINALIGFFMNDSNVIFAYLFGGLLKDRQSPLSDVDIAVYIKNIKNLDYLDLFDKTTNVLGTDEVDIVVLNTSPISLTGRILQNRKILIDKDPFLRHRYESITLRKYFDFAIKERDILGRRYGIG
ncbi:MAG TPA: nucleotidyltransferase domain-containing protein [Nitrospirae bacterium]|nr:nucleotidyltransferase domain protein [bacterium BMS3Abin06]HDH10896.1 nucleotidyltransferase domain-containing protein [Nitrospirota bacterium]